MSFNDPFSRSTTFGVSNVLNQTQTSFDSRFPKPQPDRGNQSGGEVSSERPNPFHPPQEGSQNDPVPVGQEQGHADTSNNSGNYSGASSDNALGSVPLDTFSHGNSAGNNGAGPASGAFGHGSAAGSAGGTPYTTSLGGLSTSLLNMGLPAFAALPTFIPSFEPKRDSEPPYRPQVQPQPPQPQPRPEPQPAVQAQQAAPQAAAPKPPRGPKRRSPAHKRPACASSKRALLRGKRPRPKRPRKPPFRPSASRPPPWRPSPARWPRTSSRRPAWALC